MMKQEVAEKWVAALRSGEYVQWQGVLRTWTDEFCALGVLCDVAVKEGVAEWTRGYDSFVVERAYTSCVPPTIQAWAGMRSARGDFGNGNRDYLAWLNDQYYLDFNAVARVIENEWITL